MMLLKLNLLLVDEMGGRGAFDALLAIVGTFLLVALRGCLPIDPLLRKDGLLFGFYDGVAVEPDGVESFAGTSDFSSVAFASTSAPLTDELNDATLGIRHGSFSHLFASEEYAFESVAVAIGDAHFSVKSSLLPMTFVDGAIKELILSEAMLASIAEVTEEDVLVAVPHGAQTVTFVVGPLAFVAISVRPIECTISMTE